MLEITVRTESAERHVRVSAEELAGLGAAGLRTAWDGDPGQAIDVTDLDRRRRLVG